MNKKYLLILLSTVFIALILSQFLPWWSVMLAAFITALFFSLKGVVGFFSSFFSHTLILDGLCFWLSNANDFILAKKIAVLLPLKEVLLLILVTGIMVVLRQEFLEYLETNVKLYYLRIKFQVDDRLN